MGRFTQSWRLQELDTLLGGRWAISLRGVIIAFPFVVLAAPLGNARSEINYPFLEWSYISFLSTLPAFALYALFGITIFKNRIIRPVPWWYIFLVGIFLGAIKGTCMAYIGYKMGLEKTGLFEAIRYRAFNHAFVGLTFFPIMTLCLAAYDRYSIQRNRLLRQAMAHNSFELDLNNPVTNVNAILNKDYRHKIEMELEETRRALESFTHGGTKLDGNLIATYLRKRSTAAIRPLSHRMWKLNVAENGFRRFTGAIKLGLKSVSIYPEMILYSYLFTSLPTYLKESITVESLKHLIFHLATLAIATFSLARIFTSYARINDAGKIGVIVIFTVTYEVVSEFVCSRLFADPQSAAPLLVDGLWVIFLIFLVSGLYSAFMREEYFIENLESILSESELRIAGGKLHGSNESQELARYLHSHLQNSLFNSANVIEKASLLRDEQAIRDEIFRITEALHLPDSKELNQVSDSIDLAIKRSKGNWDGLMKIRSRSTGEFKVANPVEVKKVEKVLEEALSNAFRHGKAKEVFIEVKADDSKIELLVTDDGVGPAGGTEGMGSQTFDTIAGKSWKLEPAPSKGARLSMSIERG